MQGVSVPHSQLATLGFFRFPGGGLQNEGSTGMLSNRSVVPIGVEPMSPGPCRIALPAGEAAGFFRSGSLTDRLR